MARRRTGTLLLRPRNGVPTWHAQVWVGRGDDARREWFSLETCDKPTARRKMAQLVRKLAAAEVSREEAADTARSSEAFESYARAWLQRREALGVAMASSERGYLERHILPELGVAPLVTIGVGNIVAVIDATIAKGLSHQTVTHVRAVMNRIFAEAWRSELIKDNPVAKTLIPSMDEEVLPRELVTDDEFRALMAYPGDPDAQDPGGLLELKMLSLLARCEGGMRSGDLNAWDWAQIDRVHFASCIIPRRKTRKKRPPQHLEVPEVVRPFLRAWHERDGKPDEGPVFPVTRGVRAGQFKATGSSYAKRLRRELKRALVWAKIPPRPELFVETKFSKPVDFHSFRRSFKTALAEAGISSEKAMHLSGSTDPKVHARYVMNTAAMRLIPTSALPQLDPGLAAGLATKPDKAARGSSDSSLIPERDTRFELATSSLGS